jgi:hypothetical protein
MAKEIEYTENRHLDCKLTDEEVKQYGEDLAHRLMDISALELEKARLNVKIKPIKDEVEKLVVKIDTKQEVKEVVCDWHFDWERGEKRLIRTDTFEEVPHTTFDISEDEKQQKLEMES